MKNRGLLFCILAIVMGAVLAAMCGCSTTDSPPVQTVFNQPCDIYEVAGATPENSLICKLIENPCAAQKLIGLAAKAGAAWKPEYVAEFDEWVVKTQAVIDSGVTYESLQSIVLAQISKLNKEAGMALLIVSDGIFVFNGEQALIGDVDKKLLSMSLEDLRAQVQLMAILAA